MFTKRPSEAAGAPTPGPLPKVNPLTEVLDAKQLKLLGHTLRRPRSHPQHQVTFSSSLAVPRTPSTRRVGRPRAFWTIENMKRAWEIIKNNDSSLPNLNFDPSNRLIRETLIETASCYRPPFDQVKLLSVFVVAFLDPNKTVRGTMLTFC